MRAEDRAIWERFVVKNPDFFERVEYDVHVGSKPEQNETRVPPFGGDFGNIYQKKIDVVADKNDEKWIVELKPRAGAGALGQVLGYRALYLRDISASDPIVCLVITDVITADMPELAKELGVELMQA